MYCPDWIFDIVCAEVASLYLKNDVALEMGAQQNILLPCRKNMKHYLPMKSPWHLKK